MKTYEVHFDGLIRPNHNFSGLAFGNLASERNALNNLFDPAFANKCKTCLEQLTSLLGLGHYYDFQRG